jgi:hypothetical protein
MEPTNNSFDEKYQWQIDRMLEYRKQYEDKITEGEHLIVQNRVRESYLGEVNFKIAMLERERDAMNNAKSGMEMVIMHQTFNGHAPFSWGRDGNESRASFRVEPLPLYKEVLQLNIDIINDFNAKTHAYPKYIIHYLKDNKCHQRIGEVHTYRLGRIKEHDIYGFDYDSLKKLLYSYIPNHYLGEDKFIEVFHSVIPFFHSNDDNLQEPFHEWIFPMRCSIKNKDIIYEQTC